MSLTSIPMPRDDSSSSRSMYSSMFEGPVLGNMATCQLQAFVMMLGLCASSAFYPCLSVYYALTIAFHFQYETIRKYIEPFFYIVALGKGLAFAIWGLVADQLNNNPLDTFCSMGPYPFPGYNDDMNNESTDPAVAMQGNGYYEFGSICLIIEMTVTIIAMAIILYSIAQSRKRDIGTNIERQRNNNTEGGEAALIVEDLDQEEEQNEDYDADISVDTRVSVASSSSYFITGFDSDHTKELSAQAMMYIALNLFIYVGVYSRGVVSSPGSNLFVAYWYIVVNTGQGVFNLLIFIYHKIYSLRKSNASLGYMESVLMVLVDPQTVPSMMLSNLDIVSAENKEEYIIRDIDDRFEEDEVNYKSSETSITSDYPSFASPTQSQTTNDFSGMVSSSSNSYGSMMSSTGLSQAESGLSGISDSRSLALSDFVSNQSSKDSSLSMVEENDPLLSNDLEVDQGNNGGNLGLSRKVMNSFRVTDQVQKLSTIEEKSSGLDRHLSSEDDTI
ncbi:hypothetical protein CTEN210_17929 [Chaetoceros tenuissimus]|uniref:Uncharacterized protein n=1 Tax=Chaetoceros tenuissimus TaxID=426638 RepID=A0AAD3DBP7_9STRA|nr:hypothetical protein CTEN210_17929 [Chaetoceros tenuissimus]